VFLCLINFTLERFGDTAGRLLAVEARTAHVRLGLTYVFIVRAEAGISKLEWESLRVPIVGSTDKPWSSCARPDSRRRLSPHDSAGSMRGNKVYLKYLTSKTKPIKTQALFAPSRLRDREASFLYRRVSLKDSGFTLRDVANRKGWLRSRSLAVPRWSQQNKIFINLPE
jgi:hypothetical protein